MKKSFTSSFLLLLALTAAPYTVAQWKQEPSTGSPTYRLPDRTTLAGQSGLGPVLTAALVEKDENAKRHRAVVVVHTDGVILVDAAKEQQPRLDQGHVQYRVDNGKVVNTTATSWTLDGLSSGHHRIDVCLAANDNKKIGRGTTLIVDVP